MPSTFPGSQGATTRRLNRNVIMGITGALLAFAVVWYFWPSARYEYNTNYKFASSMLTTSQAASGREVDGRLFTFSNGRTFASPIASFGRPITILDRSLPANTFRIVKREVPKLQIGAHTFDPGGVYDEVRYNMARIEPQTVVPRVTPGNKPPTSKQ